MPGVRQPLDPLPLRAAVGAGGDGQHKVVGCVERGQLGQHRADQGAASGPHVHPGEAAHGQRHRQVRDHRVRVEEAAQRAGGHRLEVVERPGHRRDERGRERLRPDRRPGPRRSRCRPAGAPTTGGCRPWTTAVRGRGAGRTGRSRCRATVARTCRRSSERWRRYSRRAATSSALREPPLPHEVASIASDETPNMAPTTYEYAPPPRPIIIAIATPPPSMGSSISNCCQRPPVACGSSGGAFDAQLTARDLGRGPAWRPAHQHRRHAALPSQSDPGVAHSRESRPAVDGRKGVMWITRRTDSVPSSRLPRDGGSSMHTGLALVTVSAPHRRVDVALPQHVPLADLLPEMLAARGRRPRRRRRARTAGGSCAARTARRSWAVRPCSPGCT